MQKITAMEILLLKNPVLKSATQLNLISYGKYTKIVLFKLISEFCPPHNTQAHDKPFMLSVTVQDRLITHTHHDIYL